MNKFFSDNIMKSLWRCMTLVAVLLALGSCKENEPMEYALDGRVYFYDEHAVLAVTEIRTETNYSFAMQKSTLMQDTIKIPVKLMGAVTQQNRVFRAEVVADSTTAQTPLHYELLDGTLFAGEYMAYLPVVVKRTEDTKTKSVSLKLRLISTPDLGTGNPDMLEYKVNWADMLMPPANWPSFFWGPYSTNKYRFAIDVLGMTDWPQASRFESGPGFYSASQLQQFATKLNRAYAEHRKTHGPIYVDDNAEVKEEISYKM